MKLVELKGDLFNVPSEYALAHCVSSDFRMGAGIALEFKKKFGSVQVLKNQHKTPGEVAFIKFNSRHIYYLITKKHYWNKPTITNFKNSLWELKKQMQLAKVSKLAMPKIGCGLDRLAWCTVKNIIKSVFIDSEIKILIYYL